MENNDTSGLNEEEMSDLMKELTAIFSEIDWDALAKDEEDEENP
tara:strand:- start:922 stop:1053 length:132 start_codon:yes stop_codon:yes gene_type:complete